MQAKGQDIGVTDGPHSTSYLLTGGRGHNVGVAREDHGGRVLSRETPGGRLVPPVGPGDRILGPEGAPITLVVYGDYCCARTREAWPVAEELVGELAGRVRLVWRHFPGASPSSALGSWTAAKAAEAAASQGKFWEMHPALFEAQKVVRGAQAARHAAASVGLDRTRFEEEVAGRAQAAKVIADFEAGLASGVRETPAFFVDGVRHDETYALRVLLAATEPPVAGRPEGDAA